MKVQKNISISVELASKLSLVDNVSELVERLLWQHLKDKKEISADNIINEIVVDEETAKKQYENQEKFFVAIDKSLSDFLERPATKEEVEEYIFRFKSRENVNLFDYAEELKNAKQQLQ